MRVSSWGPSSRCAPERSASLRDVSGTPGARRVPEVGEERELTLKPPPPGALATPRRLSPATRALHCRPKEPGPGLGCLVPSPPSARSKGRGAPGGARPGPRSPARPFLRSRVPTTRHRRHTPQGALRVGPLLGQRKSPRASGAVRRTRPCRSAPHGRFPEPASPRAAVPRPAGWGPAGETRAARARVPGPASSPGLSGSLRGPGPGRSLAPLSSEPPASCRCPSAAVPSPADAVFVPGGLCLGAPEEASEAGAVRLQLQDAVHLGHLEDGICQGQTDLPFGSEADSHLHVVFPVGSPFQPWWKGDPGEGPRTGLSPESQGRAGPGCPGGQRDTASVAGGRAPRPREAGT